jgi:hypothetical protein
MSSVREAGLCVLQDEDGAEETELVTIEWDGNRPPVMRRSEGLSVIAAGLVLMARFSVMARLRLLSGIRLGRLITRRPPQRRRCTPARCRAADRGYKGRNVSGVLRRLG